MLRVAGPLLLLAFAAVRAIPVDNGVEGEPEIECGPTGITVNFNTRNEFEGKVYVKGLFAEDACVNKETGRQVAGITLPFDTCNTRRQRSLNPRGVFVSTTVIITFHPLFVTKVDRAYRIQCFYMEADKTVSTELEVSMLTTDFRSQNVPMPVCRYELLNPADQTIVEYATVGQPVLHKWTCDTETVDTFCMVVHSCFVDDKNGDRVDLLDAAGCAQDRYLLNNPEYPMDLMGQVEAHVFKYADRPQLYFECQIAIFVKEPGQTCPRPNCPTPAGRGAGGANPKPQPPAGPAPAHLFPIGPGPYSNTEPHFGQPQTPGAAGAGAAAAKPAAAGAAGAARAGASLQESRIQNRFFNGRRKRAAAMEDAVGTVDVSTDLESLEVSQNLPSQSPQLPSQPFRPVVRRDTSDEYCVAPSTVLVSGIVGALVLLSLLTAVGCLFARRSSKL